MGERSSTQLQTASAMPGSSQTTRNQCLATPHSSGVWQTAVSTRCAAPAHLESLQAHGMCTKTVLQRDTCCRGTTCCKGTATAKEQPLQRNNLLQRNSCCKGTTCCRAQPVAEQQNEHGGRDLGSKCSHQGGRPRRVHCCLVRKAVKECVLTQSSASSLEIAQ